MKKILWYILLMVLALIGLTFCDTENLSPVVAEEMPSVAADEIDSLAIVDPLLLPVIQDNKLIIQDTTLIQDTHVTIEFLDKVSVEYTISDNGGGEITGTGICLDTCRSPYHEKRNMVMNISYSAPYDKDQYHTLRQLTPGTKYYVRAWAINNLGWGYGEEVMFTTPPLVTPRDVFNPDLQYGSVSDIEGNVYATIQIGTQIWMAENLKTTRYNNGSQIPVIIAANPDGVALNTAACYWYNNDSRYKNSFGALYNHYAVNAGNLCPTGWHVPDNEEWKKLEMTLGMTQAEADVCGNFDSSSGHYIVPFRGTDQGTQMKATYTWRAWFDEGLWDMRDGNGTNTSGFSALPTGDVGWGNGASFYDSGDQTSWWCSGSPIVRTLSTSSSKVGSGHYPKQLGINIRCLKD